MKESLIDYLPGRLSNDFADTSQIAKYIQFKKKNCQLENIQIIDYKIFAAQSKGIILYAEYEIKSKN